LRADTVTIDSRVRRIWAVTITSGNKSGPIAKLRRLRSIRTRTETFLVQLLITATNRVGNICFSIVKATKQPHLIHDVSNFHQIGGHLVGFPTLLLRLKYPHQFRTPIGTPNPAVLSQPPNQNGYVLIFKILNPTAFSITSNRAARPTKNKFFTAGR
jgi:hypothetical protein